MIVVVASASDKSEPPQSTTLNLHTNGSEAVAAKFRPALIDELTALILQYGVYDREDRETLASELGLTDLFRQELGVMVTGAGYAEVNGFYHRRHAKEGPPKKSFFVWPGMLHETWLYRAGGRSWYQKDDGCHIMFVGGSWFCCASNGRIRYYAWDKNTERPPSGAWGNSPEDQEDLPAPTVRLVGTKETPQLRRSG